VIGHTYLEATIPDAGGTEGMVEGPVDNMLVTVEGLGRPDRLRAKWEALHRPTLAQTGQAADPSSGALHDGYPPDRAAARLCGWCEGPIPAGARSDSIYCSTRCRQAAHRFGKGRELRVACGRPLRLAYADPPYPGKARLYRGHPDYRGEVDHVALVEQLVARYPDGWALSTSAEALPAILPSCPPAVRVAAWFRGERPTRSYRPLSAWEPVLYCGGRAYPSSPAARRLDALVHVARIRTTDPCRCTGAKPAAFCWWLFDLLGALPGDDLVDLFPGSGGVARAWGLCSTSQARNGTGQRLAEPRSQESARDGLADLAAAEEVG